MKADADVSYHNILGNVITANNDRASHCIMPACYNERQVDIAHLQEGYCMVDQEVEGGLD